MATVGTTTGSVPPMKTKKCTTTTTKSGAAATTTATDVRSNPNRQPWSNDTGVALDHRLAMGVPSDPEVVCSSQQLPATERRHRLWRRPLMVDQWWGVLVFIVVFIDLFCASESSSILSGSSSSSSHRTLEQRAAAAEVVADLRLSEIYGQDDSRFHPSREFSRHSRIQPRLVHGRHKRSLASTREESGLHASHLTLSYRLDGRTEDVILDLQLNERLVPRGHFLSYQQIGGKVVRRYNRTDEVDLCHYRGVIRDVPESTVALSTCDGIRGVVFDGHDTYYIESDVKAEGSERIDLADHYIYRHSDLLTSAKCGYEGGSNATHDPELHRESEFRRLLRHKRATAKSSSPIRGPYNANKHSSYVELVIVIDNKMFKSMKENFKAVQQYCKDITNIINALYEPLNIFIGLVGVVIWNEANEIELSTDGEVTLKNFLHYRKKVLSKDHPNDNAQLFTKEHFEGGDVPQ